MDVKEELLDIVTEYIDTPKDRIDTSVGLKFIGLNSFVTLSMVAEIEEHFGISIPDNKLPEFSTLDDIIGYIEQVI
ncbi:MAG: acyl carrier protein [Bacteroidaceae bacterium]|nr:acyl carrier protein [Bacteroidaceae bacterium]